MEKVIEEEVEIEKANMEVVEDVLEIDEREAEPPITNEKILSLVDQTLEPKTINMSEPSKDIYLKKEETQSVVNSTTLSKKEELITLLDKYMKRVSWMIVIIMCLSPVWLSSKKKVRYKISVQFEEVVRSSLSWKAPIFKE